MASGQHVRSVISESANIETSGTNPGVVGLVHPDATPKRRVAPNIAISVTGFVDTWSHLLHHSNPEYSVRFREAAVSQIDALVKMQDADAPLPVIGTVPGDCGLRVALMLKRECLLVHEMDTEATVLLKVQRILKPGEQYLVGDIFGGLMGMVSGDERTEFLSSLQGSDAQQLGVGESQISYPGLVGNAIAIYL